MDIINFRHHHTKQVRSAEVGSPEASRLAADPAWNRCPPYPAEPAPDVGLAGPELDPEPAPEPEAQPRAGGRRPRTPKP